MIKVVSQSHRVTDEEEKGAVESKEKEGLESGENTEFVRDACGAWVDELFTAGGCRGGLMVTSLALRACSL